MGQAGRVILTVFFFKADVLMETVEICSRLAETGPMLSGVFCLA